jgi:hypothetical protein
MKSPTAAIAIILLSASMGLAQDQHLSPAFRKEAQRARDAIAEMDSNFNSEDPRDTIDPDAKEEHKAANKRIRDVLIPEARKVINEASYDAKSASEKHVVEILRNQLQDLSIQGYHKLGDYQFKAYFDMGLECQAEAAYYIDGSKSLSKKGLELAKEDRCTYQH